MHDVSVCPTVLDMIRHCTMCTRHSIHSWPTSEKDRIDVHPVLPCLGRAARVDEIMVRPINCIATLEETVANNDVVVK
jgi:hypothetical protein